ncbi:MAG: hypothetical protein GXP27_04695 [Planctomycetes bacterium]|nr:hypothetical protein [Planctomycetota bacterium]
MGDPWKEQAKAAKKLAKAQAKAMKKGAALPAIPGGPSAPTGTSGPSGSEAGLSPAERSAAAAEEQVHLRRRELWVSIISTLIALVTLILSFLSWFS